MVLLRIGRISFGTKNLLDGTFQGLVLVFSFGIGFIDIAINQLLIQKYNVHTSEHSEEPPNFIA